MSQQGVSFRAILFKIATEPSGGWRVQFDVPESDSEQMLELSKKRDVVLVLGIVPIEDEI